MALNIETLTLPAAWASLLVNGDNSGMHESDIAACEEWQTANPSLQIVGLDDNAESRFTWSFRLYGGTAQGGEVLDYIAHSHIVTLPRY